MTGVVIPVDNESRCIGACMVAMHMATRPPRLLHEPVLPVVVADHCAPHGDAGDLPLRVRLSTDATARTVLDEVGRALGAAPFWLDEKFARMAADLPVFVRQSHAEKDFAVLGDRMAQRTGEDTPWQL